MNVWDLTREQVRRLQLYSGLSSEFELVPLPMEPSETLYRTMVTAAPHNLQILFGTYEDFKHVISWFVNHSDENIGRSVLLRATSFLEMHPEDSGAVEFSRGLIAFDEQLPSDERRRQFRRIIGSELWLQLSKRVEKYKGHLELLSCLTQQDEGSHLQRTDFRFRTLMASEGTETDFQARGVVENSHGQRLYLQEGQPLEPSLESIFEPDAEDDDAVFGMSIRRICKRMVGGDCTVQFVELGQPGERRVIEVADHEISNRPSNNQFRSIEVVQLQDDLFYLFERTDDTTIKGIKVTGEATVKDWRTIWVNSELLSGQLADLDPKALDNAITLLVGLEGDIFQKIEGENKAVELLAGDSILRVFSSVGKLHDLVLSGQVPGSSENERPLRTFGVPVGQGGEWQLVYERDRSEVVRAGDVLQAAAVADAFLARSDGRLTLVESSDGTIGIVVADPSFHFGKERYLFVERFLRFLNEYLITDDGGSLIYHLDSPPDVAISYPERLNGWGHPALGDQPYPEGLRLVLVLGGPEGDGFQIIPYDLESGLGSKSARKSGSATLLKMDVSFGLSWGLYNYKSHFSQALLEIMRACSYVLGQGKVGLSYVAQLIFKLAPLSPEVDIENKIRSKLFISGKSVRKWFGPLNGNPDVKVHHVDNDYYPDRFGFEIEMTNIHIEYLEGQFNPLDIRKAIAFTEGWQSGYPLFSILSDHNHGKASIEVRTAPITVGEYNEGTFYDICRLFESIIKRTTDRGRVSVHEFVDVFNSELKDLADREGKSKYIEQYRLTIAPKFDSESKAYFKRVGFNEDLNVSTQMTVSVDFDNLGDPLSMSAELVYTRNTIYQRMFLLSQQLAENYASRLTRHPSAKLRSFFTLFLFGQMERYSALRIGPYSKTNNEYVFRVGYVDPILSILDDSDVDVVKQFLFSESTDDLIVKINEDIDRVFKLNEGVFSGGWVTSFPTIQLEERNSLSFNLNSMRDAVQARKKYGRFSVPVEEYPRSYYDTVSLSPGH
ncbi:MAG: hypothetical protein ACPG5T_01580, partial [Endozoicomonas sp.]